jgi:hypothetical protein
MVVKRIFIVGFAFTLVACQSEKDAKIQRLRDELQSVQADLASCDYAQTQLAKEQGEVDEAQWDVAAAKNMDSMAPEQEAEIRESLGDQMGIAPSKVDWKGVYERRAEAGKTKLTGKNYGLELAQQQVDQSCVNEAKDQQRAWKLEDDIKRLGGAV